MMNINPNNPANQVGGTNQFEITNLKENQRGANPVSTNPVKVLVMVAGAIGIALTAIVTVGALLSYFKCINLTGAHILGVDLSSLAKTSTSAAIAAGGCLILAGAAVGSGFYVVNRRIDRMKKEIQQLQEEKKEITSKLNDKTGELESVRTSANRLGREKAELNAQNGQLNLQIDQLTSQIKQLTSQITGLNSDKEQLTSQIKQLNLQITELNSDKRQLNLQIRQLNSQITQLNSVKGQLNSQINQLNSQKKQLESKVLATQAEHDKAVELVKNLKQQLNETKSENEKRYQENLANTNKIQESMLRLEKEILELQASIANNEEAVENEESGSVPTPLPLPSLQRNDDDIQVPPPPPPPPPPLSSFGKTESNIASLVAEVAKMTSEKSKAKSDNNKANQIASAGVPSETEVIKAKESLRRVDQKEVQEARQKQAAESKAQEPELQDQITGFNRTTLKKADARILTSEVKYKSPERAKLEAIKRTVRPHDVKLTVAYTRKQIRRIEGTPWNVVEFYQEGKLVRKEFDPSTEIGQKEIDEWIEIFKARESGRAEPTKNDEQNPKTKSTDKTEVKKPISAVGDVQALFAAIHALRKD